MTGEYICDLIKNNINPVIKFTKNVEKLDLQFDEGHFARILNAKINKAGYTELVISEKEYSSFNKDNEKPNWVSIKDKFSMGAKGYLKYSDEHTRKELVTLYLDIDEIDEFEIVENCYQELIDEYMSTSKELSYIEWLQEKLLELRAYLK